MHHSLRCGLMADGPGAECHEIQSIQRESGGCSSDVTICISLRALLIQMTTKIDGGNPVG